MKTLLISFSIVFSTSLYAQVETDKPIVLTGADGERYVTGLELPVNNVDAASKEYVDAAVAGSGGGGAVMTTLGSGSLPTMMSAESGTTHTLIGAVDYCRNLDEDSHSDWRLPSMEEVFYLRANDATYGNIPNPSSTNNFWVYAIPTLVTGNVAMRGIVMNFSDSSMSGTLTTNAFRVRCVR